MNRSPRQLLLALLTAALTRTARAQDTEVLFLGNSYTARNDLPALVEGHHLPLIRRFERHGHEHA
jgi:hypothetical protein